MRIFPSTLLLLAAGCVTGGPPRSDLNVTMTGVQAVPGPGDPDGTGTVTVRVEPANSRVCWTLYARDIDPATGAHIHRGAPGQAGPPVVLLATPDAAGRSEGCAPITSELARELTMQPQEFHVNVHTTAFPAGAIRGQLRGGLNPRRRAPTTR